jgi:ParB family chromosome partitioning protein
MSLKDKSAKIDFSALPLVAPLPANAGASRTAKTAPGALLAHANDQRSELLQQNEALKAEAARAGELQHEVHRLKDELQAWDGVRATKLIDPQRVVRSKWANRDAAGLADEDFKALRRDIESAGGNVQPIKVRPIPAEQGEQRYELVYGHRRHQACLELGLPVLAVVDSITDAELFVDMDRENRARKDLSAWEQGRMYLRALEEGLFASQRKLAEAVGADLSNVGKALRLARLPQEVVDAFASPLELQYRFAQVLDEALQKDPDGVIRRARSISSQTPRPAAKAVMAALVSGGEGSGTVLPPVALKVSLKGQAVGAVSMDAKRGVAVTLQPGVVPADRLEALQRLIETFLTKGVG